MPKVEIDPERLERVARFIGDAALQMGQGSMERLAVERLLLNDAHMVAAFIDYHTAPLKSESP